MNEPLTELYNYPLDRSSSDHMAMMFGFDFYIARGNVEYEKKRNKYKKRMGFKPNYGIEYNILVVQVVLYYVMFTFRLRLNKVGELYEA